jgi:4-hydroxy-2,2'-bipyrrole-5-carbaldehyde O-methyltransferase
MKLKYIISLLRTFRISGFFPLMKDWQAFLRVSFIYAGIESGLLQALVVPASREDLIRNLKVVRAELLDALLDVGLASGELSFKKGAFAIKGKRSRAMNGKDGDMLSAMIQANMTYYHSAYSNAAARLQGGPLGDDLKQIGDLVARFSKIGEPILKEFVTTLVAGGSSIKVLDVGCGSGIYLQTISRANSRAEGIGVDQDEAVAEQAGKNIRDWGLENNFRIMAGDIHVLFDSLEGPFDLITLFNIMYYFPNEERLDFLGKLRSLLSPQGVLAIAMHVQGRGRDLGAANLNMVNCSLKGLTPLPDLDDLVKLLKSAGFSQVNIQRLIPGSAFYGIAAAGS